MMKKFFLLFVCCVMAIPSYAMYWGCNNLTKEEIEKAKSVLKEAQEIVLLSYPYTPNIIKYDDIKETTYNADNNGFVKMFEVHNFGVYGANDLFVRFNDKEKYQNLGLIIECEAPLIDFVKEINQDLSFITNTIDENFRSIQKQVEQLKLNMSFEYFLEISEITSPSIEIPFCAISLLASPLLAVKLHLTRRSQINIPSATSDAGISVVGILESSPQPVNSALADV